MRSISAAVFLTLFLLACPASGFAQSEGIAPTGMAHLGRIDISGSQGSGHEGVLGIGFMGSPESFPSWLALNLELMMWGFDDMQGPDATASSVVSEDVEVDVFTINTSLAGVYPLLDKIQAYGQIGLSYYSIKYKATGIALAGGIFFPVPVNVEEEDKDTGTELTYGFGLMMRATEKVNFGIHARHYDIDSSSNKFDIQDINAGGAYVGLSVGMSF